MLKGDEIRIKQILNNLLSNAVKYTEKGSITLTVEGAQKENTFYLSLSVADTGIGIKKEDMEKLFTGFQRLELNRNRHIEGTGLGLNITRQLVNQSSSQDYLHAPDAHIMIVDDTRMNLRIIEMLLKRSEIQLDLATGGYECLISVKTG